MRIAFTVPGLPRPKGRPRFARIGAHVRAFTPSATIQAEGDFLALAMAHRPERPLEGAIVLGLEFVLSVPSSWPAWKREAAFAGAIRPTARPDLDNMAKLVLDALNGVFWRDDAQIAEARAGKRFGESPCTMVTICAIEEVRTAKEWRSR